MRTILLIAAMLMAPFGVMAQGVPTATLHHGGEFKTFYSASAFSQALAEAQPGDVISLSAGTFKGGIISVPVSVRGVGIGNPGDDNSVTGARTVISDQILINVPANDEDATLSIEGMECAKITMNEIHNPIFSKMRINDMDRSDSNSQMENLTFVHCILGSFYPTNGATLQLFNCVLPGFQSTSVGSASLISLNNCVINLKRSYTADDKCLVFNNCIFNPAEESVTCLYNDVYDCVTIMSGSTEVYGDKNAQTDRNNRVFPEGMKVFADGGYYRLTEEAAKYLGSDGTQVGIYGSSLPFSVKTSYPQIKKFKVAPESTADGKLKIEIEIDAND